MKLTAHRYGKAGIRVLKVLREAEAHRVKELEVSVLLEGDFASSYTAGDNSAVVATDTMKNTVNVLAHRHLGAQTEPFTLLVAEHFLQKYPQVSQVTVETSERIWQPLTVDATPAPHAFSSQPQAHPTTQVRATRDASEAISGVADLLLLKTAGSAFTGFPRSEFTTLPETQDRLLATALTVTWTWHVSPPPDFAAANSIVLEALIRSFARLPSPSVQATLYKMAEAALTACPDIARIHLRAPNLHCLRIDLGAFGIENANELFVPTDDPHGEIEATVARE